MRGIKHQIAIAKQSPSVDGTRSGELGGGGVRGLSRKRPAMSPEVDRSCCAVVADDIGLARDRDRSAVDNRQSARAEVVNTKVAATDQNRVGAVDRHASGPGYR